MPTNEQIEAAAKAMFIASEYDIEEWPQLETRKSWLWDAYLALSAAEAVALEPRQELVPGKNAVSFADGDRVYGYYEEYGATNLKESGYAMTHALARFLGERNETQSEPKQEHDHDNCLVCDQRRFAHENLAHAQGVNEGLNDHSGCVLLETFDVDALSNYLRALPIVLRDTSIGFERIAEMIVERFDMPDFKQEHDHGSHCDECHGLYQAATRATHIHDGDKCEDCKAECDTQFEAGLIEGRSQLKRFDVDALADFLESESFIPNEREMLRIADKLANTFAAPEREPWACTLEQAEKILHLYSVYTQAGSYNPNILQDQINEVLGLQPAPEEAKRFDQSKLAWMLREHFGDTVESSPDEIARFASYCLQPAPEEAERSYPHVCSREQFKDSCFQCGLDKNRERGEAK